METRALLHEVADRAADWLDAVGDRPVAPASTPAELRVTDTLGDDPVPVGEVVAELVREATPGLTAINSPRFFGFVMGGAHPSGIAADWLATAWDQNAGLASPTPAAAAFEEVGAWVHVDGAFGLWAAASPSRRHLVRGVELADSWTTDAHKWLNVPYDCGIAFVRDREAHRAAISVTAAYLVQDTGGPREPMDWTPEFSRRARGIAVYATLRALGRQGVAELVDRLCACAERFARRLGDVGFEVLAQEHNQVLVACGDDEATDATLAAVQADGTCYPTGTTWRGRRCIRISVCNWQTTPEDVDRSIAAMAAAQA